MVDLAIYLLACLVVLTFAWFALMIVVGVIGAIVSLPFVWFEQTREEHRRKKEEEREIILQEGLMKLKNICDRSEVNDDGMGSIIYNPCSCIRRR